MKRILFTLLLPLALIGATCDPPPGARSSPLPSEPERQLRLANTLAQSGDFPRAIHLFSIVAENFPETEWGATATHKTALLLSSPRNPSRNDSLAILWFRNTIARTKSPDEQLQAEVSIALLDRLLVRAREARRQRVIVDSVELTVRRQAGTILSQTRRLQERLQERLQDMERLQAMEREVASARNELKKLKEVDINLSRSRQGR